MAGAIIIGQTTDYGTWADLRTAFGYLSGGGIGGTYNREYDTSNTFDPAFKSAAPGSGWIRASYRNQLVSNQNFILAITNRFNPAPPPLVVIDADLRHKWWDTAAGSTFVPKEIQDQLIGQTVTTENGNTFAITSALFTNVDGQRFLTGSTTSPGRWVTSIGKLTPIT
jgi:hypothetical protein